MAPVEPDALAVTNTMPLVGFATQILGAVGLTAYVITFIHRAAKTLPPPTGTRSQVPLRRRYLFTFGTLAFLSLASVTTFALAWRVLSYLYWAEANEQKYPGTLWSGWYGTGDEGVGYWRLGDWQRDQDLDRGIAKVTIQNPEGYVWTSQHFLGLMASVLFMGVEGLRRNIPAKVIAALVVLAQQTSLGFSLNLFFISMLYTPVPYKPSALRRRRSPLFAPWPLVYWLSIAAGLGFLTSLPKALSYTSSFDRNYRSVAFKIVLSSFPLFVAFAQQLLPMRFGNQLSKAVINQSFKKTFLVLGLVSTTLCWTNVVWSWTSNMPPVQESIYDVFLYPSSIRDDHERLIIGLKNAGQKLKLVSTDPAISMTISDILFTAISLSVWTFARGLDVDEMLGCSFLTFLSRKARAAKHVEFESDDGDFQPPPVTPKRGRGRPRKNGDASTSAASAPSTGTLRRSTRRKATAEPESEEAFQPSREVRSEAAQMGVDGTRIMDETTTDGEAAALSLFLGFTAGLGQLAASVLGAEIAGSAAGEE